MTDRQEAVERMALRRALGVALRHPDDRRSPPGEAERERQQKLLFAQQTKFFSFLTAKEVAHGAA